jgi:prepilin-type N-terminal cleavage/methylation domain-containing protein
MLFEKLSLKNRFTIGFSLTEVVITIAIVSVLAGLAVPGIMTSANNNKRVSSTKQTMSLIGDALNDKLESNAVDTNAGFVQFVDVAGGGGLPYVRYITSGAARTIDRPPNSIGLCTAGVTCPFTPTAGGLQAISMKNGGLLLFDRTRIFGTGVNAAIPLIFDPDGELTGTGDRNAVELWLYSDGRLRTARSVIAGTTTGAVNTAVVASGTADPAWLVL